MTTKISGLLLSILVGIISYLGAQFIPMVNSIVLSLGLGILISNLISVPPSFDEGIHFSSKSLLEWAIIFMGFGISFMDIQKMGFRTLIALILTIIVVLLAVFYYSKKRIQNKKINYLIGFGTAICGSSAIAALSPKVDANKQEIGIAIAVINLFGLVGMIALPLVLTDSDHLELTSSILGGSLHGVGNVAGAGYAMNESIGDLSLTIKLGRVALLAPALIFFNFLINRKSGIKENLMLPYYLVGFIMASLLISIFDFPTEVTNVLRLIGNLLLTIAMGAIGLSIKFKELISKGKNALGFGLSVFIVQLIAISVLGYLL